MLITFGRLMIYRAKQEHFVGVSMVYVMLGKAPQNRPSRGPGALFLFVFKTSCSDLGFGNPREAKL